MALDFKAIVCKRNTIRQFSLRLVVIVIMGQMREERFGRANAPRGRQCFVKAHVRRVRLGPKGVEDGNFDAADLFHDRRRDFLAIAQIREPLPAVLHKEITVRHGGTVRQGQGSDLQVPNVKGPPITCGSG